MRADVTLTRHNLDVCVAVVHLRSQPKGPKGCYASGEAGTKLVPAVANPQALAETLLTFSPGDWSGCWISVDVLATLL